MLFMNKENALRFTLLLIALMALGFTLLSRINTPVGLFVQSTSSSTSSTGSYTFYACIAPLLATLAPLTGAYSWDHCPSQDAFDTKEACEQRSYGWDYRKEGTGSIPGVNFFGKILQCEWNLQQMTIPDTAEKCVSCPDFITVGRSSYAKLLPSCPVFLSAGAHCSDFKDVYAEISPEGYIIYPRQIITTQSCATCEVIV